MNAYSVLFPTLDFSRVHFHEDPPLGSPAGLTLTSLYDDIDVYIKKYDPCSESTFFTFAHELVHALQAQENSVFGGKFNGWIMSYMLCLFNTFSADDKGGNGFENEAYAYERQLTAFIRAHPGMLPCACEKALFVGPSPVDWGTEIKRLGPELIKSETTGGGDCASRIADSVPVLGQFLAVLWQTFAIPLTILVWSVYSMIDGLVSLFQKLISWL